jgi:hypothetical protein
LKGRLDFSLQEGLIEHSYLSALNAHISYWQDQDVAIFMLQEFYGKKKEKE